MRLAIVATRLHLVLACCLDSADKKSIFYEHSFEPGVMDTQNQ
jgi:hypothetical protein